MILNSDLLLRTEYSPASDILQVSLPDMGHITLSELLHSITAMTDAVRIYNIQKIFIDNSKAVDYDRDMEGLTALCLHLVSALSSTRVQRIARLQNPNAVCEAAVQRSIYEQVTGSTARYSIKTFLSKHQALAWLSQEATSAE